MPIPRSRIQSASFKGASFLMDTSDYEGGRKIVKHEYPNQNTRDIEDLGLLPPIIRVKAIITGNNYFADRDRLIQALNQAGPGTLVHPFYGAIEVTADPFVVGEAFSNLGQASFDLVFYSSSPTVQPSPTNFNLPSIAQLAAIALGIAEGDFSSIYGLIYSSGANYLDALGKARTISAVVNQISGYTVTSADTADSFGESVTTYNDNVTTAVANPEMLATNINTLLNSFSQTATTPEQAVQINSLLFPFGSMDIPIVGDFYLTQERQQNRLAINDYIGYIALVNSYTNSTLIDYTQEFQLNNVRASLDIQYEKMALSLVLTADSLSALKDLRVQMNLFFNNVQISIPKVEVINTNNIPLTVLTYNYYGNTDQLNNIFYFNEFFNPSTVSGDVSIFTS